MTCFINKVYQNWDNLQLYLDVNSKGSSKKHISFLCSEMQYGPYDAYMEVPYKNVDKDTKLDLPYSYNS